MGKSICVHLFVVSPRPRWGSWAKDGSLWTICFVSMKGLCSRYCEAWWKVMVPAATASNKVRTIQFAEWLTGRVSRHGETLPHLFEYRFPNNASRQGLGFVEEHHHMRPRWLGGTGRTNRSSARCRGLFVPIFAHMTSIRRTV